MKRSGALALAMLLLSVSAFGGRTRRPPIRWPAAPPASESAMTFSFVDVPGSAPLAGSGSTVGQLDLGSVSGNGSPRRDVHVARTPNGMRVSTQFGILVNDPTGRARTASLMAWIPVRPAGVTIQIDGVPVDASARVVAPHLPAGRATAHRVDIAIPGDLTEEKSQLFNNIQFILLPE